MSIVLRMRPQYEPLSWEQFCELTEPFAIAIDGYVDAGPLFQDSGPRLNLSNHHAGVDRLATRSTCAQVLLTIRQGLFTRFRDDSGARADVYCNDCDEDVCMSWFLLKYGYLAEHAINPVLNRLVVMEDLLEATAGAYPFPVDLPLLQELAWVFEPYRRHRLSGVLDQKDPDLYTGIVTEVEQRILRNVTGRGERITLDTRYERIDGGRGWAMVREIGAQAHTGILADGVQAYVTVHDRGDGRWNYTVGRMSPFIPFNVPRVLAALNAEEKEPEDRWTGGATIGMSSRTNGSRLSPKEIVRIVNSVVG